MGKIVTFPSDAGVAFAQRDFGCVADGVTDTTVALQAAITATTGHQVTGNKRLYLETGTYLVSDTLFEKKTGGIFSAWLILVGQDSTGTIIKLKNSAAGFGDVNNPKAVLFYAGNNSGDPQWPIDGSSNQAFINYCQNLTIDVGSGNPGAIALDYIASNDGLIEDVTLIGTASGYCGYRSERNSTGPGLIKNLTINGFDYGIRTFSLFEFSAKNLTLSGQRTYGIYNNRMVLEIDGLHSTNTVPALFNEGASNSLSAAFLINSNLDGGAPGTFAIVNEAGPAFPQHASLFLRDVTSSGYAGVLQGLGSSVSEYCNWPVQKLFDTATGLSIRLPQSQVPAEPVFVASQQQSVVASGGNPTDASDDSDAIQAALNSGKPYVYAPPVGSSTQQYTITRTVTIPPSVEVFDFFQQILSMSSTFSDGITPVFRVIGNTSRPLFIRGIVRSHAYSNRSTVIQHESSRPVVLQGITGEKYRSLSGAGNLYCENISTSLTIESGQNVWAWCLNTEADPDLKHQVYGSLWCIGLKTEREPTQVTVKAGGIAEILGSAVFITPPVTPTFPCWVIENGGKAFLAYEFIGFFSNSIYPVFVRETRNGTTKDQTKDMLPTPAAAFARFGYFSGDSPQPNTAHPGGIFHKHHSSRLRF